MSDANRSARRKLAAIEHEDMGAKAVFGFLLGLAVLVVVVYFVAQRRVLVARPL